MVNKSQGVNWQVAYTCKIIGAFVDVEYTSISANVLMCKMTGSPFWDCRCLVDNCIMAFEVHLHFMAKVNR